MELGSLVLLRSSRLGSIATKELRRTDFINPFFKTSDSYSVYDTWRQQYYKEVNELFTNASNQASNKWKSLGLWSAHRYHGKCINIDKYNLRRSIGPVKRNVEQPNNLSIHFFGGSAVWGWEVRDVNTIPSKILHFRNDVTVENHGQLGYVSSQSVITFIQRIKYEPKPDIVIFVDGLNDIYSAFQSGVSGIEQNAISIKQRFESKSLEKATKFYLKKSNFVNLMRAVLRTRKKNNKGDFIRNNELLAHSIITAYNQNIFLVSKMASAYNIKALFIWLPTLFDKPNLTEYEHKLFDIISNFKPLYSAVKKFITVDNLLAPQVINLSNIFYQNKEPIYVDPWHYNEHANHLIAEKINEAITNLQYHQLDLAVHR
jgi:hypothetical protein